MNENGRSWIRRDWKCSGTSKPPTSTCFFSRKSVEILERQKRLLDQALKLTESHYAVGSGAQSDIFKAQIEISRMDEMIIPMREMAEGSGGADQSAARLRSGASAGDAGGQRNGGVDA